MFTIMWANSIQPTIFAGVAMTEIFDIRIIWMVTRDFGIGRTIRRTLVGPGSGHIKSINLLLEVFN